MPVDCDETNKKKLVCFSKKKNKKQKKNLTTHNTLRTTLRDSPSIEVSMPAIRPKALASARAITYCAVPVGAVEGNSLAMAAWSSTDVASAIRALRIVEYE